MSFDWPKVIKRNHALLSQLIALVAAMVRLPMSEQTLRGILLQLRPLESAMRRLISIAARDVTVTPRAVQPFAGGLTGGKGLRASFPLFDPRLHPAPRRVYARGLRISSFDNPPVFEKPKEAPRLDPEAVQRRIARLQKALDDLPRQARRLVRWRMRHPASLKRPMRPGRPPGLCTRRKGPVQGVLQELQVMALYALEPG